MKPLDLHLLTALDQTLLALPVDVVDRLLFGLGFRVLGFRALGFFCLPPC